MNMPGRKEADCNKGCYKNQSEESETQNKASRSHRDNQKATMGRN